MKNSSLFWPGIALMAACLASAGDAVAQPYRDPDQPVAARVSDLLARMTPEEKFWQLFMLAGGQDDDVAGYTHGAFGFQLEGEGDTADAIVHTNAVQRHFVENTRLGIPVIFFAEALHGLVRDGATVYPQAVGLAATFDPGLMQEVARAIARECRRHGVRQVLSPVVNVAEDVRWGRVEETYGEDPFLVATMGAAFVTEFERLGVVTTPKHLVANVGRGGRDSYPVADGERRLREVHLPPFAACLQRGGSRSVMTAYNSLDGRPCTANAWLLTAWLKKEMGFTGFVISDAGAVGGADVLHGTASGYADAAAQALNAGLDVIFQTSRDHAVLFLPALQQGWTDPLIVDDAVAGVLRVKFELGLFEEPYVAAQSAETPPDRQQERMLALRAARAAIVLLENSGETLPLDRDLDCIAVLGPDAAAARLGGYSGSGGDRISILEGIRRKVGPSTRVLSAEGCPRVDVGPETVPTAALSCTRDSAVVPGLVGAYFDNIRLTGDPVLTRVDPAIDFRWTLVSPDPKRLAGDFYAVRWTGTLRSPGSGTFVLGVEGDDGYRLSIDGEVLIENWRPVSSGLRLAERALEAGRDYDLSLEFQAPTGQARVRLVWERGGGPDVEDGLREAVVLAARADAAIVVAGIEEGEFRDRADLALPGRQEDLIWRVAATGTPTVVVLVAGSAVTVAGWRERVSALLQAWYAGEAGGEAVAEVLFGDVNPAGRLPVSFPVSAGQLPLVYNHKPTGRGDDYADLTGQPQYPFGYGLSFTSFEYADLQFEPPRITVGDTAYVRCRVTNVGARAGDEVVQLYIRDELASVSRPVIELKGFRRIHLDAGETTVLRFELGPGQLGMLDRNLRPVIEPGDFRIMIGASCRDIRLRGVLRVDE